MVIKAGALLCLDMDGVVMLRFRIPDFSCPVQRLDAYVRGRGGIDTIIRYFTTIANETSIPKTRAWNRISKTTLGS